MLYMFIILFIILLLVFFISLKQKGRKNDLKNQPDNLFLKGSYVKKNFLSNRERDFFNSILNSLNDDYILLSQVRLVDIVQPNISKKHNYSLYMSLFRSISQYHVDFIIVRRSDFFISCVIELDDSSHDSSSRKKRDDKVNDILNDAGLFFIRSKDTSSLLSQIKDNFS